MRIPARASVWLAATALAGLGTGLIAAPVQAAVAVVETELSVPGTPERDGRPVRLDATLLTTDPQQARPAVVLAHGFGGTKADSLSTARLLARDGYAVAIYTARGFGASGGLIHLDDPAYEGADVSRVIDALAARPEMARQGSDPVVGVAGASYGGAVSLMAAALDPRVDAIVPAFTWNDLGQSLFPQYATTGASRSLADVPPAADGVFKARWSSLLFLDGGARSSAGSTTSTSLCGRFDPTLCREYLAAAASGRPSAVLVRLLARSSPRPLLSRITAPTLLIQGEDDTLFGLDQADATLRGLPAATPSSMRWVPGGHDRGISTDALVGTIESWFGRYLKADGTGPDTSFSAAVPQTSLVGQAGQSEPDVQVLPAYPGRDGPAPTTTALPLTGPAQRVIAPPGGSPAALTNLPGTGGALGNVLGAGGYNLAVLPGQSATFTTAPLTAPLDLVGSGRVSVRVSATTTTATLFASLWDLGPEVTSTTGGRSSSGPSSAVLPELAVAPVRLTGLSAGGRDVTVALPAVAHQVPVGHRLQLVLASTDQAYALPTAAAIYTVALAPGAGLVLPELTGARTTGGGLDVPLPLVIVVAALLVAAVVAMVVVWRRRRVVQPRPELLDVPLIVEDLVKTYGDGFKAVAGVSFAAKAGRVVGLLGPNGAGKTTVMRMLVGLIRPDSGSIYVHGQPVHGGADVLGSVGAFIEGPGFLPHLTGAANLAAYWQATGRAPEDAHLDEALAIAGLGSAIDRRVRGYSQGMRQRLGIAQAMLGLPRLLLLDEPTNGLDPPQIKAMRTVLTDYAATGRTVVVSSHLLSEVEQTCTDVVVMNRGRVVLTGSVAELTADDSVTLVGLAEGGEVESARRVLQSAGLRADTEGGLLRVSGDLPRAEIVRQLVDGGFPIDSIDGHRQLEEVFLSLVGAPPEGEPASQTLINEDEIHPAPSGAAAP